MSSVVVGIDGLGPALDGILEEYGSRAEEATGRAVKRVTREMAADTRATAPVQPRDGRYGQWTFPVAGEPGRYRSQISWRYWGSRITGLWYVKGGDYPLTHLLEHGHESFVFGRPTGRRAKGTGFVGAARDRAAAKIAPYAAEEIGRLR